MLSFALKHMATRRAKLVMTALSVIITASVALLAYNISTQVSEGIVNTAAKYDIIIGPAGSATQLAMNTMFFTDKPLGTIPYALVSELENSGLVNAAIPFSMQLANTMAVYAPKGGKFEYTDRPVRITGRMELGDFTDEYGYTYNYRIVDAKSETVDLSQVSADYAMYQALAEDGVIADVNAMFDYLLFVCQWPEYQGGYTDERGQQISYNLYPGDMENALADDSGYGYATQADADYFPGLIRRVQVVNGDSLKDLTDIITDAQALEQYARGELAAKHYRYDEASDKYILDDNDGLYDRFYEIYGRFSQWLTRYEL